MSLEADLSAPIPDETHIRTEQTRFILKEEAENDDHAYRHSYFEEQLLMQAIREGRSEDAITLAENMDNDAGRLSSRNMGHWHNLVVIGIALCSRAAIEGGIPPESGYRISGYYIKKCDTSQSITQLLQYRNRAIIELTSLVREHQNRPNNSYYTERCKDYVRKHYRDKIYLQDIAQSLGISAPYLSRLFKEETGGCIQNFINGERISHAAALLIYSDLSLPEIAQYVHFPNQSYFGKVFKQFKNMTPKAYRNLYQTTEYSQTP